MTPYLRDDQEIIPSPFHIKHPSFAWFRWNVEFPNKKPWFRVMGVLFILGGWDYHVISTPMNTIKYSYK